MEMAVGILIVCISDITDPLYLPLKRGGPVCPLLESPRRVLQISCNSLLISLFSKQANCLSHFRGDGRGGKIMSGSCLDITDPL